MRALVTGAGGFLGTALVRALRREGHEVLLGRRLPLSRKMVGQILAPGWTCETGKARRLLGFEATIGLAESVGKSARWYEEMGWIRPVRGDPGIPG